MPSSSTGWHRLRVDLTGSLVDVWFDGLPVVTQDFGSLDVLRGSFGLITGPGSARFRNVRYLAREARDPGAWVDRRLRMEPFQGPDASLGGSWLHRVPPFPHVAAWLSEPRTSWFEKGPVPTLVVFWSPKQNDLVPLNEWLSDLARRYADVGLEIVSISEPEDPDVIRGYLAAHPFPGSAGVDFIGPYEGGFGETFEQYGIGKYFNLPRLVLLDVDGKAVWEGDPGFELNKPWREGDESYLDTPLEDLVARRSLRRLAVWHRAWRETGIPALESGDAERLFPLLLEARGLPGDVVPAVREAQEILDAVESALRSLEATVRQIAGSRCDPAVEVLLAWAARLEVPLERDARAAARRRLRSGDALQWKRLLGFAADALAKMKPGREEIEARIVLRKSEGFDGLLAARLRNELRAAVEEGNPDEARRLLEAAPRRPARWLLGEYLGLSARRPPSGDTPRTRRASAPPRSVR